MVDQEKKQMHWNICTELNSIYERKNHDYGDSFHKSFEEWGMMMACIRLDDKLNRLKTFAHAELSIPSEIDKKEQMKVLDESIDDTLMDLANYAIMTIMSRKRLEKGD